MSLDWTHEYCLSCDKQTDGTTYCSESCRLADYDKTSAPSSPAGSGDSCEWGFGKPSTSSPKFYLSPAYEFSTSQHGHISQPARSTSGHTLSPSPSQTSLCSIRTTSSAGVDTTQLSNKAARELRAYAHSFESVRLQRRRSH